MFGEFLNIIFKSIKLVVLVLDPFTKGLSSLNFSIWGIVTSQELLENGRFSLSQGVIEESYNLTITAMCGIWTQTQDSSNVRVIIQSGVDSDGDGIPNDSDSCPYGYGSDEGWSSELETDRESGEHSSLSQVSFREHAVGCWARRKTCP